MVPESPSVCFRCKMCKVCFLTMNEIERHLKATNHYIRPSSNSSNSTKENSTANNETSDDKPLNLSSKSKFPPLPIPAKSNAVDLTLSSEDSEEAEEDDKKAKGANALESTVNLQNLEEKKVETPRAVTSRTASKESTHIFTHLESSLALLTNQPASVKGPATTTTTPEDLADVETDTVSSTSSDPLPPADKVSPPPPPPETITEAEASTQFPEFNEKTRVTNLTSTSSEASMEVVKKTDNILTSTTHCDDNKSGEATPMHVDEEEEDVDVTSTDTLSSPHVSSNVATSEGKEKAKEKERPEEKRIPEECDMSTNENDEPVPRNVVERDEEEKTQMTQSNPKNKKQKHKYRCKHCGDLFRFPVQVHVHMQKMHSSSSGESTKPAVRRTSINISPTNNNNNNDTATSKHNVQMYPLRSLYARAKRRTRSMQSDSGGGGTRRNSFEEKNKEKKSTTRKISSFTCRRCGKKFPMLNQLRIHTRKVHPKKAKKSDSTDLVNGEGLTDGPKKHLTSKRLVIASKRRQTTPSSLTETQNRSLRISTRSASRSADSEPETMRMSTRRRSSMAPSEKSHVGSVPSSRRSSTRREELRSTSAAVKAEQPKDENKDEEETVQQEEKTRGKSRCSSSSSSNVKRSVEVEESETVHEEEEENTEEEEPEIKENEKVLKMEEAMHVDNNNEEDSIYNDSDCMIIDTVETILYALTSKRSQTCPNCNKYCKFAGNFKLHLKACMNLDDDLEVIHDDGGSGQKRSNLVKEEPAGNDEVELEEEVEEEQEETEEEMEIEETEEDAPVAVEEEESEKNDNSENEQEEEGQEGESSLAIPYYQKLEYRRCWECGFVVSKFHNLSRHLKQRHDIRMGTKEMHAKQAEILRLSKL